jgi:hypothetical protein
LLLCYVFTCLMVDGLSKLPNDRHPTDDKQPLLHLYTSAKSAAVLPPRRLGDLQADAITKCA